MSSAIVMHTPGDADVLRWEPVEIEALQPTEVRVKHTAIGVNFHDAYVRSGLYKTLTLPGIPGLEAAGFVEAVGCDVSDFSVGDRVAYVTRQYGAYAERRNIDANLLIPLPGHVSDSVAASSLLKGLTAQMLVQRVHNVQAGDWVLVHAAAGGVGTLICQWASGLNARVIGVVSSEQKAKAALAAGCHHTLLSHDPDLVTQIMQITHGAGVNVAYDSVGKDTFDLSLESLGPCGHLAHFGQSSGPVPAFEISRLFPKSNSVSRPSIFQHLRTKQLLQAAATQYFNAMAQEKIRIASSLEFPLRDAARAHQELENRNRLQTIILRP